ncbi:UDP-glucosyltransferase 29-like [Andrographis paniculata]|uniref:UDP-glucosyltransferase 29-like n=1 Tax=Andrographis paniculata TaxID=175694 RepID=UPI0021E9029F|nr:UDP-glucosyltransferase 29-like [Andrographis paniculata]
MDPPQAPRFKILMFPWLAHGHISPYLGLSKRLLATKNFHIYVCSTAINITSIQSFIQSNNLGDSMEAVELKLEPSVHLPPHYHTTKNLPSHLFCELLKAFPTAKSSFSDIITAVNPDLIVFDSFQPWAAKLAASRGIPAVHFFVAGAATQSFDLHHYCCPSDGGFQFQELSMNGYEKNSFDELTKLLNNDICKQGEVIYNVCHDLSSEVVLLKTSWSFEGKYINYVSSACNKKVLPTGPLVVTDSFSSSGDDNSDILQWLSKKDHHSTVYISFGSEYFLSGEEVEAIAKGLELCEVNFIWVLRFPLGEETKTIEETLPLGFLERVKERGIVTGWAPQAKILQHPGIGAFLSHCGWSSIMESMYFGVPIIGMPMKVIMVVDTNMLVGCGVCLRIPRKDNEGYKGEDIAMAMSDVIFGESGERLRCRAEELSEKMRMEEVEETEVVANQLWKICLKNRP